MLEIGDTAPDFCLPATGEDAEIRLSSLRGTPVVVYFYPRDAAPGSTIEAREFRDFTRAFEKLGAHVLGISPNDLPSHEQFAEQEALIFPLLADTDATIAKQYGVWVKKTHKGKEYMGILRSTFLLDAQGRIHRIWRDVHVKSHAEEVFNTAEALVLGR